MLRDLAYSLGTIVGTGIGVVERRITPPDEDPSRTSSNPAEPRRAPSDPGGAEPAESGGEAAPDTDGESESADRELLVDTALSALAGWVIKRSLRPRPVSWPRVVVAGIGATILADVVGRALGPESEDRDRAYEEDPDALLVRLGAGLAMAAGYAALLYPRLPGSPLAKGLAFGVMEIAAAPHGGLVRVASDTPGLKFPLRDLAIPIDRDAGPLANLTFGIGLGLLYRPRDR